MNFASFGSGKSVSGVCVVVVGSVRSRMLLHCCSESCRLFGNAAATVSVAGSWTVVYNDDEE